MLESYINKITQGDALETVKLFPDKSINSVITSPPYWQLRDYKWNGQWGLEPTFQLYLENLWSLMDEIYRVLKDDGTCWINLGDTYGGNKKGNDDKKHIGSVGSAVNKKDGVDKCLLLLPHRFAIGCIDRNWIMRNDCIWAKRNGMPESVTDRFSKKHEYFFFMTKSKKYYFDLDSIRDKNITQENRPHGIVRNRLFDYDSKLNKMNGSKATTKINKEDCGNYGSPRARNYREDYEETINDKGKNPGSVSDFWDITTKGSGGEHYAKYNDSLLIKPILAGCPEGGIILDPFAGEGTTGNLTIESGRKFIGIEGKKEYVDNGNKYLYPVIQKINSRLI